MREEKIVYSLQEKVKENIRIVFFIGKKEKSAQKADIRRDG